MLDRFMFSQQRIGYGKKPFSINKIRTMRGDEMTNMPPELAQAILSGRQIESHRITNIGSILRRFGLDELPISKPTTKILNRV